MLNFDDEGWISEEDKLKTKALDYICDLYTKDEGELPRSPIKGYFPQLS